MSNDLYRRGNYLTTLFYQTEQMFLWAGIYDSVLVSETKQRYEAVSQTFCCGDLRVQLFNVSTLGLF